MDMINYAVNWCVSRWNGRDTMDVIFLFISRPGGLTRKRCKSVDRTIFFLIQIFFLNIHLKLTNHRYFIIKNPSFFTIHNKNGVLLYNFKSKWPYPESDQSTGNPLFTMTTSQRACQPVMTTRAFYRRNQHRAKALPAAVLERRRSQKRLGDAWVSFHPTDVVNLAW